MRPAKKKTGEATLPLFVVPVDRYARWLEKQSESVQNWLAATQFKVEAGKYALLPSPEGGWQGALACIDDAPGIWSLAHLPGVLPKARYRLDATFLPGKNPAPLLTRMLVGWRLAAYQFTEFKTCKNDYAELAIPRGVNAHAVEALVASTFMVRDLINLPANRLGPTELARAASDLAFEHRAECSIIKGNELLRRGYPAVYAVGQASANPPHLVDIRWGKRSDPKVTLVGKGVCFDSGGLNIKTGSYMELMKKDMGGAACVLGLARLVMQRKLPVRLRVLIPAVENSISGNAMRPLDVIKTRKGLTVEVGNTDAEGRIILSDALYEADTEAPDLLIDCATLTGAARVALGADMPAFFTDDETLARQIAKCAAAEEDPLWRLPLHKPYLKHLKSRVADLTNNPPAYGGAITAALFLEKFVEQAKSWVHLDMMAWNLKTCPGRPQGGEAMGLRALFALLCERYA